jgi:coenzyme F420-reducing hydrogenase delta subunit
MYERTDGRVGLVSEVDPSLCVSCGICAGSCAPMGVGPPQRTGRFQLTRVKQFVQTHAPVGSEVVIVACERGAGGMSASSTFEEAPVFAIDCGGAMHTSVVEFLVRSGVAGVLIVSCPPRDCWSREGPKWLEQRLYHDREAELKPRVDRRRVRLVYTALGERHVLRTELRRFRDDLRKLRRPSAEDDIRLDTECAVAEEGATP